MKKELYKRHTKKAQGSQNWCAYVLKDKDAMNSLTNDTPPSEWEDNLNCEVSLTIDDLGKIEDLLVKYHVRSLDKLESILKANAAKGKQK